MKESVTVVPCDNIVIVEGGIVTIEELNNVDITEAINSSTIHAIQWANGQGHVEYRDESVVNQVLVDEDDYNVWLAPFVSLWEEKKASLEEAQAMAEAEALALYNSEDARAERVRSQRDSHITACDWVITRHRDEVDEGANTTLSANQYAEWLAYRKALRDLPSVDGFPWDGGGEETPWPDEPTGVIVVN